MTSRRPKLYIIHGWTYTIEPWAKTIAALEAQGLAVEMLRVPGLTTNSKKEWTIDEYVEWANRNLPVGATALGHSNGGRILLNLAVQYPEKLGHLILLDAAGVYEPSGKRDVSRGLSKRFGFLKRIPGLVKIWHKLTGASDYARAPENMKKTLSNMLDSDKHLDLTKVSVPTSILWGLADTVTPPRMAEVMKSKIPVSAINIQPGWTHAPYISHPADLARHILRAYKNPPVATEPVAPADITQAAAVSASMALKKAAEPVIPSTAPISASLSLKKSPSSKSSKSSKPSPETLPVAPAQAAPQAPLSFEETPRRSKS